MCGVSRQGAWPTPGSRSESYAEFRRPSLGTRHRFLGDRQFQGINTLTSASWAPLLWIGPRCACFKNAIRTFLTGQCPSLFFCINTRFAPPLSTPPHPLIHCPVVQCSWQSCASVLNLHPQSPSRRKLLTITLSHSQQYRGRIC
jgi:hypothetical protein